MSENEVVYKCRAEYQEEFLRLKSILKSLKRLVLYIRSYFKGYFTYTKGSIEIRV